jgi:hypothetical protein
MMETHLSSSNLLCRIGFHSIAPTRSTSFLTGERIFLSAVPGYGLTDCDRCGLQLAIRDHWWPALPMVWRAPWKYPGNTPAIGGK